MDSHARNEGMVAIITGLRDAGLSVTVSDARQLGPRSRRNPVGHATSQGRMSSGVQTCRSPERSMSNEQFQRTAYQPVYQRPSPAPSAAESPPASTSPTRGPHTIDFRQLEDQLNELRSCLLANDRGVSTTRPRALNSPVRSLNSPVRPLNSPVRSLNSPVRSLNSPVRSPSAPIRHPSPSDMPARQLGMVPVRDVSHRSSFDMHRGSAMASPSYRRDKASNAFVESLRKYPNRNLADRTLSVDFLQRLVTQAQSKNGSKRTIHVKRVRSLAHHSLEPSCSKRPSKVIQSSRINESPTREVIAALYGSERKKKLLKVDGRDGTPNGRGTISFDCLTNSFAHAHRSTDVRYLSDVTKYVRDTLLQMGTNNGSPCPHMVQRYSTHRREFHQSEAGTLTIDDLNAQASCSRRQKKICRFNDIENSYDCKGQSTRILGDNIRMNMIGARKKLCSICNQPAPCRCDLPPPCPCPENRPTSIKDRLKSFDLCEEFRRLCNQEPLYESCTCPQNVDEIIDDLVDNWLINIPIYAGYTYKEKLTRDEIVDSLKSNLKRDIGEKLKCQKDIFACIKKLPMWLPPDKDERIFKENLGNDLLTKIISIDLFGSKVRRWVETLPFLPDIAVNHDKTATDLSRKLKDITMTAKDLRNDLIQGTYEALDNLPIKVCTCVEKEDLAERLADSLVNLPQEVMHNLIHLDDFSSVRKKVEFLEKVKKWINGIPIDTTVILDRDEIASELSEQLDTIVENSEPGELWNAVKKIARRKLEGMKIQGGHTELEIQASKLADILQSDLFSAVVAKWTKTVAFDYNSNVVRELFAHELTKKLVSSIEGVDPEEAEEVMKNIICDMLNSVPASGSLSLKVAQASKLANALSKLGSKETSELKETVKRWIEEVPFESESESQKRKTANKIAKEVKEIVDTKTPDEIWNAVKNCALKEIENIPVTCNASKVERLAEHLADDIIALSLDEAIQEWVRSVPFKQGLESHANNLSMKIKDILNDDASLEDNIVRYFKEKVHDELPDEFLECDAVEKAKLIEGLVETIRKSPKTSDKVIKVVENWLKNVVPLTTPLSRDKVNDIVKKIKNILNSTTPREQWNALKAFALGVLENLLTDCLPSEIEIIAEDLASNLASDDFQHIVKEWAMDIQFDPYSEDLVEQFTIELTNQLKNEIGANNIEEVRDAMKSVIVNELNKVPTLYDIYKKEEEAEKLLSALGTLKNDRDKILALVEKWFKTVPFLPTPPVNKIKVNRRLAKNLKDKLDHVKPESTWHELKEVTKDELKGLPVNGGHPKIEQLSENLANLLVSGMLGDVIRKWINKVPFDPYKDVNRNEVTNDLAKKVQKIMDATDPQDLHEKLTEGIFGTLEHLPVICTKSEKTSLVEDLANQISNIPKEKDQFSQTLHEWLQKLPFDPKDVVDKGKLALEMEHKLKKIVSNELPENARDAMKKDIADSLQKYKINCNEEEREKLEDTLADKLVLDIFSDTIRKWVNSIPLKPEPPVDNDEVNYRLTDKLRPKFTSKKPDKENIISTIRDEIVKLPVDRNPITKDTYLTQIANELYDKLLKCPPEETEELKRKKRPPPTFAINVKQMLQGVTVSLSADENEKIVKTTLDKLRTLRSEGKDEAFIRKELKRDIEISVDQSLAEKKTDPQARKNLANKLYTQVFDAFKDIGGERKKELRPKLLKTVKDWLVAQPEINIPKNNQEKFIQELAEKLADEAVGVGTQKHIKKKMVKIISNTIDTADTNSTLKNNSNLKDTLIEALIRSVSADIESSSEAEKKGTKERVYRVEEIKKRENETQVDEKSIKRMRSLALSFSDYSGNRLDINKGDRKLIGKNTSGLVGDLLHTFEKSAVIPEEIYDGGTGLPKLVLKETGKWIKSIPEITSSEHSTQIESENNSFENNSSNGLIRNKIIKNPQLDFKTKLILTDKPTEQLSTCSSISNAKKMPNTSKFIKKYEEKLTPPLRISSDETLKETKVNEKIAQNLADKLTNFKFQGLDNRQFKNDIFSNVEYEHKHNIKIDDITKNKLADKLLVKLLKTIGSVSPSPTKKVKKNRRTSDIVPEENLERAIKRDVKDWLNEIAELSSKPFTKEITNQTNVKGITVNIAEYKEKHEIPENKNSMKDFDFRGNRLNITTKDKLLGTKIDKVDSTVSSTSYSISTSDDETENNLEMIKKDVTDWTKDILKFCNSNPVEIEKMIMMLTEKLYKVDTTDFNNKDIRKKIRQEIVDILNYHVKFKDEQMDIDTKQILANQLIDRITKSYRAMCCSQKYHDAVHTPKNQIHSPRNTKYKIKKWIEHIPELSCCNHAEKKQIKRLTRALVKKISRISEQGSDETETKENILKIISDKLDIALKIMGKKIDSKVKQKLLDELLHNLTESVPHYFNSTYENNRELINNIKKNVEEWMGDIIEISAKTLEYRKLSGKIIKNVVEILTSSQTICSKEVRSEIEEKIMEELENIYDSKGNSIGTLERKKLAHKLLDEIFKTIQSFQTDLSKKSNTNKNTYDSEENKNKWRNETSPFISSHNVFSDSEENISYELEDAFEKDVTDWIADIPELNGNTAVHKRENKRITRYLSKALALLQVTGKDDLEVLKKMQKEIKKQIGKTFYYRGEHLDNNTKNELVSELIHKIISTLNRFESFKTKAHLEEEYSDKVKIKTQRLDLNLLTKFFFNYLTNWFDEIPELQATFINERKIHIEIIQKLARNLANLQVLNLDKTELRNKMAMEVKRNLNAISRNKTVCLDSKTKDDLINQLLDQITKANDSQDTGINKFTAAINTASSNIDKDVWICLENPISNVGKRNEDKNKYRQLKFKIKEHLESVLDRDMYQIKPKQLFHISNKSTNTTNFAGATAKNKVFQDSVIFEWVQDIPELPCSSEEREKIKCYGGETTNQSVNDAWINTIINEKDINVNEESLMFRLSKGQQTSPIAIRTKNDYSFRQTYLYPLVNKKRLTLKRSVGQFTTSPSKVFYLEESNAGTVQEYSKEVSADTQAKIFKSILNNIDSLDEPEEREILKKQIVLILMKEAELPENEAKDLAESILKSTEEETASTKSDEKQLLKILRNEIRKIMSKYPMEKDIASQIESFLMDLEVRRLFEGKRFDEDSETEAAILEYLKEIGGLSDEDALSILGQLGVNLDNLLMSPGVQRSIMRIKSNTSPFEARAKNILNDFFEAYVDNPSPEKQKNIDNVINETLFNVGDILEESDGDVHEQMRDELNKQVRKISLDTAESVTDLVEDLLEDLIEAYEKTKSPKNQYTTGEKEELSARLEKYASGIEKVIENWLDDLPLTNDLDEQFKETMIKDLAGDIIDREKYLQTHPEINTTKDEERNLLTKKCQIWMKKFIEGDDLKMAMLGTDDLIDAIKGVPVPKLTADKFDAFTDDPDNPTYMGALQKEILSWAKKLPPNIKPTVDDETMKKHINDLAKDIQAHKGKPDAEEKIRAAIAHTLPLIYGNLNDAELKELESSLFNTLMNKGFTDDTWVPELGTGDKPTYMGALQKEILGWVKRLPSNIKPTVDDETMKKHVKDLAKIIENHKGKPDAEAKIRSAINGTLPVIFGDLDDAGLKKLESSLFKTLMNKGFTDDTWVPELSTSDKPTYLGALQKEILGWAKKLPPNIKPTVDDETMKKHVNDLAKDIQAHKGKPDAEEKIRAAIAQTLPLIYGNLNDAELKQLQSSLFNTLMNKGFTDDTWVPELSTGDKPTYIGALQKEILGWVKRLPPNIKPTVDDETMKKHVKDLAKTIENHKGKPDAEEKIRSEINRTLPVIFEDLDDAELKKLESSLFNTLLNKGFTNDTWVPQSIGFTEEKMTMDVLSWLKQSPMYQKASPEEKKRMELAAIEMAKGLNDILTNLPPGSDFEKMLHDEIKKHLKNIITDPELIDDENFWNDAADNVLNFLKGSKTFQELTGLAGSNDLLARAVDNWVNTLPIDVRSFEEQELLNDAKRNLTTRLEQARAQIPPTTPQHEQAIRDEGRKFLRSNLTDPQKKFDERYIEDESNKLVKLLNMIPISPSQSISGTIKPYKSPADTLYEYIGDWVNNLPVEGDVEKVNLMKQNLASKLINKIAELNMNPDIFNDTELYQYSLSDEIDKLLEEIPRNPELDKYLPALKKELIFKVMDARQKILDELAGKVYKQRLRDKISTSLPLPGCLTVDEQASLELITDKLADAFIDLHFADCGGNEFNNYKKKISDELNRFCADLFRHYPCARIDVENIKDGLHRVLMKVPIPRDDSMKSEVEQVRIRDIVNDWMREIPLRQETPSEKLRRYKLAAVLAKHIHDIEMEKQHNDFIDSEHRIREETRKFMNIIPIREDRKCLVPDLLQKLIDRLECSEQSRRFFSSERCQAIQTPEYASLCIQHTLSSTLCSGERTISTPNEKQSQLCKDALVCTPLVDSCSQTCQRTISQKSSVAMPRKKDASCMTLEESPCHISPRILVKEYVWDSPETCTGAHEYTPPCSQRSCTQRSYSQGVQARPPQSAAERNFASTTSGIEIESSPYQGFPLSPANQHPSMYGPVTPENPPPLATEQSSHSPYNSYSGFPRSTNQCPVQPLTNPDCYCPPSQEREISFQNAPNSTEDHNEEEWPCAGPSRFCQTPYPDSEEDRVSCVRRRRHMTPERCDGDDFWNACWRYRGRPMSGYRADKIKDKCDCKERVWMAYKGRRDRFVDMCQACGTTCPHPQPCLFNPNFSKR